MDEMCGALIPEIEAFLAETGMAPSRFGRLAASDSKLIPRLKQRGQCSTSTIVRVRGFIAEQRAAREAAQ